MARLAKVGGTKPDLIQIEVTFGYSAGEENQSIMVGPLWSYLIKKAARK